MPYAHIMEKALNWVVIYSGAEICFYNGVLLKMLNDF